MKLCYLEGKNLYFLIYIKIMTKSFSKVNDFMMDKRENGTAKFFKK